MIAQHPEDLKAREKEGDQLVGNGKRVGVRCVGPAGWHGGGGGGSVWVGGCTLGQPSASAGHSEESNYSLMDPTATAPAPGATNVCLFSAPLQPNPLRVTPQV